MINFLNHTGIDKHRWDDCISKSLNRRVYAFSWYLDVVCPGWSALIEDDYSSVFPLTQNRKWGINYLFQPYFTQQLGLFSVNPIAKEHVTRFIKAIPLKFKYVDIQLNAMNDLEASGYESTQRVNHELNIAPGYDELYGRFAQNTRRNIRKSTELKVVLSHKVGVDELIELFRENFGSKEGKLQTMHYQTLRKLIVHCQKHDMGYILGAFDKTGVLSAAAFFLFDNAKVYFLFAASAPLARENGAMFFLINHFLTENAGKHLVLDFEGGNDPNLGRFYKSFGADEVFYPILRINRLPKAINRVLYFSRKLRQ